MLLLKKKKKELGALIQTTKDVIDIFSKAKAAKLIRELVDLFLDMRASTGNEVRTYSCDAWEAHVVTR